MDIFKNIKKNNDLYKINNSNIESQNIFLDGNNYEVKDLFIESNVGGRDFILSINPKTEQTKILFFNPFKNKINNNNNNNINNNKNGCEKIGIQIGPDGFLNNTKLLTYYQDKFGNSLSLSKSSENPFGNSNLNNSIFKIDETSLSYSFSLFNQTFSIISSDCSTIIGDRNNNKIHKANTGNSYKTGIQHLYKIKEDKSLFCRLHSELSIPYLSSCSFIKHQLFFTKIFNFKNNNSLSFRLDGSIGNIFNFNSNKTPIPLNERFFNGKNYGFPGFIKSSLSDQTNGSAYLGCTSYFTLRSTLFKKINNSISSVLYFNLGSFNLSNSLNNNNNNNIINSNIDKFKSNLRTSVGLGFSFDMGDSLIMVSLVKPINYFIKDKLKTYSLEILYKS